MLNISGVGTSVMIIALQSFPMGFNITQFADEEDPISVEPVEPVGYEMLYDGGMVSYDKASPVVVSIAVPPNTDDDINLKVLLQSRKGGLRLLPISDITTMIISYPDNDRVVLTNGTILSGPLADSIASSGRKKSNVYKFVFATFGGAQSGKEVVAGVVQNVLGIF